MLRNFRHARCSAGMEIGRNAVFSCILKIKYTVLLGQLGIEIHNLRGVVDGDFRTNERHNPRFRRCQIAVEIHFQNSLHIRCLSHRIGRQLWQVRFWETAQGDQDLRIRLAQDRGNLVRF